MKESDERGDDPPLTVSDPDQRDDIFYENENPYIAAQVQALADAI
jgi:hypothetical protein